ncbi:MAG: Mth938-like domain-containing protein [Burkholderiales bacterium]
MKFQPDRLEGVNAITRHTATVVTVNAQPWSGSIIVPWQGEVTAWTGAQLGHLMPAHFAQLVALQPELVIFGSGARIRFQRPEIVRALIEARIGLETMDTAAACRTYNVLASEGRRVVAALLPGDNDIQNSV